MVVRVTRQSLLLLAQAQSQGHVFPSRVCASGLYLLSRLPQRSSHSLQTPIPLAYRFYRSSGLEFPSGYRVMSTKRKAPPADEPPKKARAITSFFAKGAGAGSSKSEGGPVTNFDKDAWAKTLTDEQRRLLELELETMDVSWLAELKDVLVTNQFLDLKRFLEQERKSGKVVFPVDEDIYSWSRYCPLNKVKIVILGQDPYHGDKQAHGLSFSVRPPTPAPPSLVNMYTCLKKDYPNFKPPPNRGGLLAPWAQQGVLMLNASLTVRKSEAGSHANKGWEALTGKAIEVVTQKRTKGVVFMAWGKHAQTRCKGVDKKKHKVLESVHPSPLSAHRGFFDCGHFRKANDFLQERYGIDGIIDWNLENKAPPATFAAASKVVEEVPREDVEVADVLDAAAKGAKKGGAKIAKSDKKKEKKNDDTDYNTDSDALEALYDSVP